MKFYFSLYILLYVVCFIFFPKGYSVEFVYDSAMVGSFSTSTVSGD